jgi:putative transposase
MVSPARRREAVRYLVRKHKVSERRACTVVSQHRSTQRYERVVPAYELKLVAAMNELAARHPRYGYRRIWALLRSDGWVVNRKRIERLWRTEGHRVPPRRQKASGKRAYGSDEHSIWMLPATAPRHVWSYDFIGIRTASGATIRVLNIVDEFTRECVGCRVDRSIGTLKVIETLEDVFSLRGPPKILRSDNGREFIGSTLIAWLKDQGVRPAFIAKGSPQQNAYVERFNGTMRDEIISPEQFNSLAEARVVILNWVKEYNTIRPHRGLDMMTPSSFAKLHRARRK